MSTATKEIVGGIAVMALAPIAGALARTAYEFVGVPSGLETLFGVCVGCIVAIVGIGLTGAGLRRHKGGSP